MRKIKFKRFSGLDYTLIVLILFLIIDDGLEKLPEMRGAVAGWLSDYKTVNGKIIKSSTKPVIGYRLASDRYDIEYEYNLDGRIYQSDLVSLSANYYEVDKYLNKYPIGRKVLVYYQESNPSLSVLEPDDVSLWIFIEPLLWLFILIPYFIFNKKIYFTEENEK